MITDNIDIDYHTQNLDSFFSINFQYLIKNEKYKTSLDNSQENIKQYFINFPAFYYFPYKELDELYNSLFLSEDGLFFNKIKHYDKIKEKIKNIIIQNKLYKSAMMNLNYFNFDDYIKIFNSDESIIYFFHFINNKEIISNPHTLDKLIKSSEFIYTEIKLVEYDNIVSLKKITNYLISNIILNKNHLFYSCFLNFDFDSIPKEEIKNLMNHTIINNTYNLFLPYIPCDMKLEFEKKILTKNINYF